MRHSRLLMGCVLAFLATGPRGALADVLIKVDKSTQRMSVTVDGQDRYSWPVSTGLPRYSTPKGSYTPFRLEEDHFSKEWDDAPMPHSIFFTSRGHAIHGSDATRHLGSPASHGCIRLSRANAAVLFDLVREEGLNNTKVVISGGESAAVASRGKKTRTASSARRSRTVEEVWVQRDPAVTGSVQGGPFDRYYRSGRTVYAPYAPAAPFGWRGGYGGGW